MLITSEIFGKCHALSAALNNVMHSDGYSAALHCRR